MSAKVRPDGKTRQAVLDHLRREADMDGLVIVASADVGRELGISGAGVRQHLYRLAAEGLITPEPEECAGVASQVHVMPYRLVES